jgi:CheY-like chemotaxis protein
VVSVLLGALAVVLVWRSSRKPVSEAATDGMPSLSLRRATLTRHLAAVLAHKFNNVLTVLSFDAEMLAASPDADEATHVLSRSMLGATAQGTLLTQSMLAFAERAVLSPTVFDLETELTLRHDRLVAALDPGQVLLRTGPSTAGPRLLLKADPDALEACLVALLRNAAEAAGARAEITLELERISSGGAQQVELVVDDAGPGMDPATLALAMEPGFSSRANGHHLGLGLAAANGFARQSGGTLTLESMPGMGTRARLMLPLLRDATQPAKSSAPAVPESRPMLQSPERPKRVLIVEDSIPVRDSIARRLRADGYDVVDAVTVSEVLAYVARGVDVMVTDIVLSDSVDGWTLATRARELNPMLPLVFMSGFMTSRQPELLSGNELASFVRKPVNGAELNTVIAGLLALRETRQLQSELPRK